MPNSASASGELVALDPGLIHPAAALFRDGLLVAASRVRVPSRLAKDVRDVGERSRQVAALVCEWIVGHLRRGADGQPVPPSELVFERVQIYRAGRGKGDPNDLVPLAIISGAVAGILGCRVVSPTPREWTGGISKCEDGDPWASPRGGRVRRRLSDAELAAVTPSHDAVDAVGLGLWRLGRFELIRAYARG